MLTLLRTYFAYIAMKLLITGGAGFIGSNFVRFWVEQHPTDELVVLDALTYAGNLANLTAVRDKIRFVEGNITDKKMVDSLMQDTDGVVHFAAESHVDRSIVAPDAFIQTNIVGTYTLLESARAHGGKRFHHVSTDEVLGQLPLGTAEKWTEKSPYNPRSPYSASKAASDHLVRAYFYTYGLPVTITNCANNIGPFMYPEKLIPLAITNVLRGKKVPIYKPGNQMREWLYVEDHCRAIEVALLHGTIGETYFVSPDNEELSNVEVIKKLLNLMNVPEDMIEFVGDRPGHDQKYALDNSKIKQELGWAPQYALDEALEATITWYKNNEAWWQPLVKN